MELIVFAIKHDWFVMLPIVICSIAVITVWIERGLFFRSNRRDIEGFIRRLERDLAHNNIDGALALSTETGGILGEVTEESVRALDEYGDDFGTHFDITADLYTRSMEKGLAILGTIATIAPYLGLFGTVVRILLTFGEMSKGDSAASSSSAIMFGIGSALIATAGGLLVAIIAVTVNNYFTTKVSDWENHFKLLKLIFLSAAERRAGRRGGGAEVGSAVRPRRPAEI
jgi:biopolymer transport protein ExbB